ncbi:S-adenosyl-L-methionine-dependent methyltransferase [Aspergillus alliaceus]|uniref:S-adenosyl-L-methionine-dependent methyltransferase n=1 Tax=Petromyces alliaceus TaxID=209559 RepID=A0A5N7CDA5_PETAA|nr:S-adenosyl-L-methionine-dependent methyltransferase [Aspergillus alliaceus]
MDIIFKSTVQFVLKVVVTNIEEYLASEDESSRVIALDKALKLNRTLEKPKDAVFKLSLSPVLFMAVKMGHDLNVFTSLVDSGPASAKQLAAENADVTLVGIPYFTSTGTIGFAEEYGPGLYAPTPLSHKMTQRTTIGMMDSVFCESLPAINRTLALLKTTGYLNPGNPHFGPMQYTFNTDATVWEWLAENPEALARFNTYMEGIRGSRPHWADWFPVQQQVIDGTSKEVTRPLLVDIAGGRGHDIAYFSRRVPDALGQLILEDLPSVIEDIQSLDAKVERVKHDFFTTQSIEGESLLSCSKILEHIATAMKEGYPKLLIEEFILPDQGAHILSVLPDMVVMVFCPGMERTRSQRRKLLKASGLEVKNLWLPKGDGQGIIEAELA